MNCTYLLPDGRLDVDEIRRIKNIPCCLFPFLEVLEDFYHAGGNVQGEKTTVLLQEEINEILSEFHRIKKYCSKGILQLIEQVVLAALKIWDCESWLLTMNLLLYEIHDKMAYQISNFEKCF